MRASTSTSQADIHRMTGIEAPDWTISASQAILTAGRGAKGALYEPKRRAAGPRASIWWRSIHNPTLLVAGTHDNRAAYAGPGGGCAVMKLRLQYNGEGGRIRALFAKSVHLIKIGPSYRASTPWREPYQLSAEGTHLQTPVRGSTDVVQTDRSRSSPPQVLSKSIWTGKQIFRWS